MSRNGRVVWEMNEDNSIFLVLLNLRNRTYFLLERFPNGYSDFTPNGEIDFLRQIRSIEESLVRIYQWYYDPARSTNN